MTMIQQPGGTAVGNDASADGSGTAGGAIVRVHAFDGLFLRSEHLNRMQDYARALAHAVGAAGGPGVVEGFVVSRDGSTLSASPGLAIDHLGRPLLTEVIATLDVSELDVSADEFYWVEIVEQDWDFGSEAIQGVLCDEPCSDGTTARPYTAEGVRLQVTAARQAGLGGVPDVGRRSWLAGRLFAAERDGNEAWPASGRALATLRWEPSQRDEAKPTAVRLAVLIPDAEDGWQLDTWIARRDRGAPPPARWWQWRLGMRPWDVYVAQILQFQDLLAERWVGDGLGGARFVTELLQRIGDVTEHLDDLTKKESTARLEDLIADLRRGAIGRPDPEDRESSAGYISLPALGIGELPPAGFLPQVGGEDIGAATTDLLGGSRNVDVRVCSGQLSDVGGWIQAAQHRGRIPLDGASPQPVDILVIEPTAQTSTDWVAFARRGTVRCDSAVVATEDLDVYVVDEERDRDLYAAWQNLRVGKRSDLPGLPSDPDAVLTYPARTWAVPAGDALDDLLASLHKWQTRGPVDAVAVVGEEARKPLGAIRAELLASEFDAQRVNVVDTGTVVADMRECVVLLVGQPPPTPQVAAPPAVDEAAASIKKAASATKRGASKAAAAKKASPPSRQARGRS